MIEHPGDVELLKHLIEAREITQTTLAEETGIGKSTISEILSGKRKLTRKQIAILARYFHVGQGVFELAVD